MPPRSRRTSVHFINIVDSNNNAESETDTAPIELSLSDGTEVAIGAIVWIKHNQCLDTPVIVQHIFDDERAEVRNLIDNNVIVLNGKKHLTMSCKTLIESKRIAGFETDQRRKWAFFMKYQSRIAIKDVTTAIKDANKRLTFCKETLPKILIDCRDNNWSSVSRRLTKELSEEIMERIMALYSQLNGLKKHTGHASIVVSNDEAISIAEKILQDKRDHPFLLPNGAINNKPKKISTCSVCLRTSRSLQKCTKCASAFHKSCHRGGTKCHQCLADDVPSSIVYTYTSKQWWPAIIISDHQVPKEIHEKRNRGPGFVFVFIIGKYEYEQVLISNLLIFQIDSALRDAILKRDDNSLNNAVEIATGLDVG